MANTDTPKKAVFDHLNNCQICIKDLFPIINGRKLSRRRDVTSTESKKLYCDLFEFFPDISTEPGKSFICLECHNRHLKIVRLKNKLKAAENDYEKEKTQFITTYNRSSSRQKRQIITPQRPRLAPKQLCFERPETPTSNPLFILAIQGKENTNPIVQNPVPLSFQSLSTYNSVKNELQQKKSSYLSTKYVQPAETSFQAQIQYQYPSQTRKKIVDGNATYLKLVRAMLDERPQQIANAVYSDTKIRHHIMEEVCQSIKEESDLICKVKTQSVLQKTKPSELLTLQFTDIVNEWQEHAPTVLSCLTAITGISKLQENNYSYLTLAGSVLLRSRNLKMTAVAYIIGLLLDYGGASDATIRQMASLGVSVSPSAVYTKKNEISQFHDDTLRTQRKQYNNSVIQATECEETLMKIGILEKINPDKRSPICFPKQQKCVTPSITSIPIIASAIPSSGPIYTLTEQPRLHVYQQPSLCTPANELGIICKLTSCVPLGEFSSKGQPSSKTIAILPGTTNKVNTTFADIITTKKYTKAFLEQTQEKIRTLSYQRKEIYGDICDLRINASHQTQQNRTKDYHWFLTVAGDLRVEGHGMSESRPQRSITDVQNVEFVPSVEDDAALKHNFQTHILRVLTENLDFLQQFQEIIPRFIEHPHMEEMKKKGNYELIDLYDKNESKGEDMIDILSEIHNQFIPTTDDSDEVISRLAFGGDVLTNERAYQAQLDMANGDTEEEKLLGIIHRPEGLHRMMNFLLYIYEMFYLTSSVNDRGTMYQLKCLLDRRDVKLDMTAAYRQCKNFFDDVLDGHLTAAACHYFGIIDPTDKPTVNKVPAFLSHATKEKQLEWLSSMANDIIDIYVLEQSRAIPDIYEDTDYMESQLESLQSTDEEQKFKCPNCQKSYQQFHWLRRHMKEKHGVVINLAPPQRSQSSETPYDGIFNVASAFLKVGLLFRDTDDAYRMGDGNRLIRNAKYELLHFNQGHHIKYRLWMWRMLAYVKAILSKKEAYEYMWNMSFNLGQGLGHLIPNDNLVEINVHLMKEQCRRMGANVTYEGARKWVKCLKYMHDLSDSVNKESQIQKKSSKHSQTDRRNEISIIAKELCHVNAFQFLPGREHRSFVNFSSDILENLNTVELNKWFVKNKKRAEREMQVFRR